MIRLTLLGTLASIAFLAAGFWEAYGYTWGYVTSYAVGLAAWFMLSREIEIRVDRRGRRAWEAGHAEALAAAVGTIELEAKNANDSYLEGHRNGQRHGESLAEVLTVGRVEDAWERGFTAGTRWNKPALDPDRMADVPLHSRVAFDADGRTVLGKTVEFFQAQPDGIDQSRFVDQGGVLRGCDFAVEAVALAIEGRAGRYNFDQLNRECVVHADQASQVALMVPVNAAPIMYLSEPHGRAGWQMPVPILWKENTTMRWRLVTALNETLSAPPDGVDDFVVTLFLYGKRVPKLIA